MKKVTVYLGADIAKATLVLAGALLPKPWTLPNNAPGYRALVAKLAGQSVHVICEATGPYHQKFVAALQEVGVTVSVVNPRAVRDFARAHNRLAKTDAIDAAILADFGRCLEPVPTPRPKPWQNRLRQLVTRRAQLVEDRAREATRIEAIHLPEVLTALRQHQRFLDRQIKALETAIAQLTAATPTLQQKARDPA